MKFISIIPFMALFYMAVAAIVLVAFGVKALTISVLLAVVILGGLKL